MDLNVRCPVCIQDGTKSTVRRLHTYNKVKYPYTNDSGVSDDFWDDNGNPHHHSDEIKYKYYKCSLEHEFKIEYMSRCITCEHKHFEKKYTIMNDIILTKQITSNEMKSLLNPISQDESDPIIVNNNEPAEINELQSRKQYQVCNIM